MNKELTREVLEAMKRCSLDCALCDANEVCDKYDSQDTMQALATALLEEMDKPKVWSYAPENASVAEVAFQRDCGDILENLSLVKYTREPPKTRTRQIAEEVTALVNKAIEGISVEEIEALLNKYAEEVEGNK